MHDLKLLRQNPDAVAAQLEHKGVADANAQIARVLELDEQRRKVLAQVESLNQRRNEIRKEQRRLAPFSERSPDPNVIGVLPLPEYMALSDEAREARKKLEVLEDEVRQVNKAFDERLLELPNGHAADVPIGESESDNVEVGRWGEVREFDFEPKPHWELGEALGIFDFERAVKISGARFYALRGAGARLERALIALMLDVHVARHGYEEIFPPFLVRSECMIGTGQLPKFGEDAYHIPSDDLYLVPTAEVPVTNFHREEILDASLLPIKYCAYTACFRREAGAAGRDSRGLIRVHQFNKVELVKFAMPESSYDELESLRANAEAILELLDLPYRTIVLCTADLTFSSAKTYDIEVWLPAQNAYREISSCSNFEAFQARRAEIRYRPLDANGKPGKPDFVHTLNGSGLAVGRTMAAIMENNQSADGSITIPKALRPYMGGLEKIEAKS